MRTTHCGPPHPQHAFTLIELLVVIAIVAVLAAMLFPVFSRAREKARQIVCTSNMRQVATALTMYADDHDGLLPPASTQLPGGHFSTPWQGHLDIVWWDLALPYLRDERILYCPSTPKTLPAYFINSLLSGLQPGPLDGCSDPSRTILLFEYEVPSGPPVKIITPASSGIHPIETKCYHHFGKMNVCFADGHIKLLSRKDVLNGNPYWKPWK